MDGDEARSDLRASGPCVSPGKSEEGNTARTLVAAGVRRRQLFRDERGLEGCTLTVKEQGQMACRAAAEASLRAAAETKSLVRRTMGSPMEARMVQRMMQHLKEKRTMAGNTAFEAAIEGRVAEWIADKAATGSATCIGMAVHVWEWKEFGGVPQQDRGQAQRHDVSRRQPEWHC